MNNSWQKNSRSTLKGAKESNAFFQTEVFFNSKFPIKIPLEFAKLINKSDKNDPLLKQVIARNNAQNIEFSSTPVQDEAHSPVAGLIHKYQNRVLLIASRVCAIHCQYCFRQNFDYQAHDAISNWGLVEQYISSHTELNEVILSGGDPLSLSDEKLQTLIDRIARIPHIKTLRIHTRSALVTPNRITEKLANTLKQTSLNVVLVVHANHPRELSREFANAIKKLSGVTLLNQSVLLQGVNDKVEILCELSLGLFSLGILPYYLNMLDKVVGAEHFWLSDERCIKLHQQLKQNLSGYLVPKLVRDNNNPAKDWLL